MNGLVNIFRLSVHTPVYFKGSKLQTTALWPATWRSDNWHITAINTHCLWIFFASLCHQRASILSKTYSPPFSPMLKQNLEVCARLQPRMQPERPLSAQKTRGFLLRSWPPQHLWPKKRLRHKSGVRSGSCVRPFNCVVVSDNVKRAYARRRWSFLNCQSGDHLQTAALFREQDYLQFTQNLATRRSKWKTAWSLNAKSV